MNKIIFRFSLIAVIGVLIFLIWNKLDTYESGENTLSLSENVQETVSNTGKERIWSSKNLQEINNLHPDLKDSLYRATIAKSYNGQLFIVDYGDMRIKVFSPQGKLLSSFGDGLGRGPGQFTQILGLTVLNDKLYAVDLRTLSILIFDLKTQEYLRSILLDRRTMRVEAIDDHIVALNLSDYDLFDVYDQQDSLITSFGKIVKNQTINPLSLSGNLITDSQKKTIIFAPNYASYLFHFGIEGSLFKTVKTIDGIDFSITNKSSNELNDPVFTRPRPDIVVLSATADSESIFLLNNRQNEELELPASFIDVYDISSGSYISSIKLDKVASKIVILDGILAVIDNETSGIELYRF